MAAVHLELLVEEPSMELFLRVLLPRLLPPDRTFEVHSSQGKSDLFGKLESRLKAYAAWLPADWRIVVIVDRDDDDCRKLKQKMEGIAQHAGLITPSNGPQWQLVNRIAVEELEAWYFGDWEAVRTAYPRLSSTIPAQRNYRNPDAIAGGTWEALERILKRHGYFKSGLRKIELARTLGELIDPEKNRSKSFRHFRDVVREAVL